jgi:hypothetical protein
VGRARGSKPQFLPTSSGPAHPPRTALPVSAPEHQHHPRGHEHEHQQSQHPGVHASLHGDDLRPADGAPATRRRIRDYATVTSAAPPPQRFAGAGIGEVAGAHEDRRDPAPGVPHHASVPAADGQAKSLLPREIAAGSGRLPHVKGGYARCALRALPGRRSPGTEGIDDRCSAP